MKHDFGMPARTTRKKLPGYKRQHKAARLRSAAQERKASEKVAASFERRDSWSLARTEAAFKGCGLQ